MRAALIAKELDIAFWKKFLSERGFAVELVEESLLSSVNDGQEQPAVWLASEGVQPLIARQLGPLATVICINNQREFGDLFKVAQQLSAIKRRIGFEQQFPPPPNLKDSRTLHFETIAQQSLGWLETRMKARAVHWFEFSSLREFLLGPEEIIELRLHHRLEDVECQTTSQESLLDLVRWLRALPRGYLMSATSESFVLEGERICIVPVFEADQCLGYLMAQLVPSETDRCKEFEDLVHEIDHLLSLALQMHQAKKLSFMDDLTVLYNQRYLPELLDREISRSGRDSSSFSVLFMDVDYFKKVNDSNGHVVGSRILKDIGHIISSSIRICDSGFRYGGDEFVIVLADTNAESAELVAERIRKKIEETLFCPETAKLNVTVSIGLACFPDHAKTREEIIFMADQAMYDGKAKSRNVVFKAS